MVRVMYNSSFQRKHGLNAENLTSVPLFERWSFCSSSQHFRGIEVAIMYRISKVKIDAQCFCHSKFLWVIEKKTKKKIQGFVILS